MNKNMISELKGPILVLGASGFIGANLFSDIFKCRKDVYGTASRFPAWRLNSFPNENIKIFNLLYHNNIQSLLKDVKPKTIFNCVAYGAYSFETDEDLILRTNFNIVNNILQFSLQIKIEVFINAGSSSEYGTASMEALETEMVKPNSLYSVSKFSASKLIEFYGKYNFLKCANLRLFSVYGPMEDSSRLIPNVIGAAIKGILPSFADPKTSRDFIFIDDVCRAFYLAALNLNKENYGDSFNIGTGQKTTLKDLADKARTLFGIEEEPLFNTYKSRSWDLKEWYSNPNKARELLGWESEVSLDDGLKKMYDWYMKLPDEEEYKRNSKLYLYEKNYDLSIIIVCNSINAPIQETYKTILDELRYLGLDYEFIFGDMIKSCV